MTTLWIGPPSELREDVRRAYEQYADRLRSTGMLTMLSPPGGERKYYVYEWFTKDTGKVFYVGKGTNRRYRHIISDMRRPRGREYKELQDAFGIGHRFLADGLTAREAELYELCTILQRTDAGEVLLQSANNPGHTWYWDTAEPMKGICASREFTPQIIVSEYRRRYFGVTPPNYDAVDNARLHVTFRASICRDSPKTIHEMDQLRELIIRSGGKVFATVAKSTQAIVEFDCINYDEFTKYKSMGLSVYHAFNVTQYLVG